MSGNTPFLILALPRSRTAWLAHYLGAGGRVGHDLAIGHSNVEGFVEALVSGFAGTVETSGMLGWRTIREQVPELRVIVIKRPLPEVIYSFTRLGVQVDQGDMAWRARLLDEASEAPGVMTLGFGELGLSSRAKWLWETLGLGPWPRTWWEQVRGLNIQINVAERLAYLAANQTRIVQAKLQLIEREHELALRASTHHPGLVIGLEPWYRFWPEAGHLANQHDSEVRAGLEPWRPHEVDHEVLARMYEARVLKLVTARQDGNLVGYLSWTLDFDPESLGLLTGNQGPWFVAPEAQARVAKRLFDTSLAELRALGVRHLNLHHRTVGRGAALGKFFERQDATHVQETYSMSLTGEGHA